MMKLGNRQQPSCFLSNRANKKQTASNLVTSRETQSVTQMNMHTLGIIANEDGG